MRREAGGWGVGGCRFCFLKFSERESERRRKEGKPRSFRAEWAKRCFQRRVAERSGWITTMRHTCKLKNKLETVTRAILKLKPADTMGGCSVDHSRCGVGGNLLLKSALWTTFGRDRLCVWRECLSANTRCNAAQRFSLLLFFENEREGHRGAEGERRRSVCLSEMARGKRAVQPERSSKRARNAIGGARSGRRAYKIAPPRV